MAKETTYYDFMAPSAVSFKVMHNGRNIIVRFSPPYNGAARFQTTDKGLADKIMAHRWFRKGIITVREEKVAETATKKKADAEEPQPQQEQKGTYNIGRMRMSSPVPTGKAPKEANKEEQEAVQADETQAEQGEVPEEAENVSVEDSAVQEGSGEDFGIESVTSLLEAKEYLKTHHGVSSSSVKTKAGVADVCAQLGITFPNFPLN